MFRLSKIFLDFSKTFPLTGNKTLLRVATSLHVPETVSGPSLQGNVLVICVKS